MTDREHDVMDVEAPDIQEDPHTRQPGEVAFALFILICSIGLLVSAYGISGFKALSAPGSVPMATTAVMVVAAVLVMVKTLRMPAASGLSFWHDVLPLRIIVLMAMMGAFGFAFKTLGFLPTAGVFLILSMKYLGKRGWAKTTVIALGSLVAIWIVFRVVFTVLLPSGIVPEAELLQFFRNLF